MKKMIQNDFTTGMSRIAKKASLAVFAVLFTASAFNTVVAQDVLDSPIWAIEAADGTWFANDNNTRGFAYNRAENNLLVVSRSGGLKVRSLHAEDGSHVRDLSIEGVSGGTFPLSLIDVAPGGQIFASNLTLNATTGPLKIYMWANEMANPIVLYEGDANGTAARFGDSFRADFTDGASDLYVGGSNNPNLLKITVNMATNTVASTTVFNFGAVGNTTLRAVRGMAPIAGESNIWVNEFDYLLRKMNTTTGALTEEVPESVFPTKESLWVDYVSEGGATLAAVFPSSLVAAGQTASIIDLNTGDEIAYTAAGPNGNGNGAGGPLFDAPTRRMFVLATNNYIASYDISAYFPEPASTDELRDEPNTFALEQNYPNPFNPSTSISFTLPVESQVELSVYTLTGQKIATLVDGVRTSGQHSVSFDASNLSSGIYIYRIVAGDFTQTNKMTLVK